MTYAFRYIAFLLCLLLPFTFFPIPAPAQTTAPIPSTGPIPPQIAAAHTIFLSNLGADAHFPADPNAVYMDVYKALAAWGHYRLVGAPDQADLIFQLRDVSSLTTLFDAENDPYTLNTPSFELTIIDPKTTVTLWTIDSPVYIAGSGKKQARWLAIAETNLVSRIKVVAGEPLAPVEMADLTTAPKLHVVRTEWLLIGGAAAFGIGGGLLLHHFYENGLASQKAQQDAFCQANNIPIAQCAGG